MGLAAIILSPTNIVSQDKINPKTSEDEQILKNMDEQIAECLKKSNGLSLSEMSRVIKDAKIGYEIDSSRVEVGFDEQTVTKESMGIDIVDQTAESLGHGAAKELMYIDIAKQAAESSGHRAAHYLDSQSERIKSSDEQSRLDSCQYENEIDKVDQAIEEKIFLHRQLANN